MSWDEYDVRWAVRACGDRAVVGDQLVGPSASVGRRRRRRRPGRQTRTTPGSAEQSSSTVDAVGRDRSLEHARHHARDLELAAHDPDVAARRAARAHDAGRARGRSGPGTWRPASRTSATTPRRRRPSARARRRRPLEHAPGALHRVVGEDPVPLSEDAHGATMRTGRAASVEHRCPSSSPPPGSTPWPSRRGRVTAGRRRTGSTWSSSRWSPVVPEAR